MASSYCPKPTHSSDEDHISNGAQGPIISVSTICAIIIGILLFGGGFGAMFYFIRHTREKRRSRVAAAVGLELTVPQPHVTIQPPCHVVVPQDASAPSYPEVENDQPPKYSTGQPPPFPAADTV